MPACCWLHAGCEVHQVKEQVAFDPRFPTVKSPNPENAAALAKAVALAEETGCDLVLATDPDCDPHGFGGAQPRGETGTAERQPGGGAPGRITA